VREGRFYRLRLTHRPTERLKAPPPRFGQSGLYVVTGPLGGLGRQIIAWLARRWAGGVLLLGRRDLGELADEERRFLGTLETAGLRAYYEAVDLGEYAAVEAVLSDHRKKNPLRGLAHCAVRTKPQTLRDFTAESFDAAYRSKAVAAWNLSQAMENDPLEFFLLFSSLSSFLSLPGMSAYAAANAVLDRLAAWRRARGGTALSLNWGPWRLGLAGRDDKASAIFQMYGLDFFSPESGLETLEALFSSRRAQLAPLLVDHVRLAASPFSRLPLMRDDFGRPAAIAAGPDLDTEAVTELVIALAARILRMAPAEVNPTEPLQNQGLDSLSCLMLAHHLGLRLNMEVTVEALARPVSPLELAAFLAARLSGRR
jgi:NAD(P)-dependent dehydrogenase (short-subunit alcohol dehydrogenase family)